MEDCQPNEHGQLPLGGLKLIISVIDLEMKEWWRDTYPFEKEIFVDIMNIWHLPLSYLVGGDLKKGCYRRHSLLELAGTPRAPGPEYIGFILAKPFRPGDHVVVFSYDTNTCTTRGLLLVDRKSESDMFKQSLLSLTALASHPMSLGLASLEVCVVRDLDESTAADRNVSEFQREARITGANLVDDQSKDQKDFPALIQESSEIIKSLSFHRSCAKSTLELSSFMLEMLEHFEKFPPKAATEVTEMTSALLKGHVRNLESRSRGILNDFQVHQERVNIQSQLLNNYIAQEDNKRSIRIAQDSRTIATQSKRDSTAMKTLAVVTTLFLPGTYVSTIFAMGMFDWNATSWDSIFSSHFWVYWVVAIPLTILVILIWSVWFHRQNLSYKVEDSKDESKSFV